MAAADAERFMNRRVVVQIVEDAVAPHVAPAIGAEQSLDGFLGMLVVDVDGLFVEQKRQRVIRDDTVVLKDKSERLDVIADDRHGESPVPNTCGIQPVSAARVPVAISPPSS